MHTNKYQVWHNGNMYNLDNMADDELDSLRTSLFINMQDIHNQIEAFDSNTPLERKRKTVSAGKIKENDIFKIDAIIGTRQRPINIHSLNLREVLIEAMEDFVPDEVIEKILGRVMGMIGEAERR